MEDNRNHFLLLNTDNTNHNTFENNVYFEKSSSDCLGEGGSGSCLTEEEKEKIETDSRVEYEDNEEMTVSETGNRSADGRRIELSREDLTVKINGVRLTLVQMDENGEMKGLKALARTKRKLESCDYTDLINEMYVKYVEGIPAQYGEFNQEHLDYISIKPVSVRIEEWLRKRRAERGAPQPSCFTPSFLSTFDDILKPKDDY